MEDEEEQEDEEDGDLPEVVQLINPRSHELYALAKRYAGVPLFPGPIIEWPDWWWRDEATLRQFERNALVKQRRTKKSMAWRESERKRMKSSKR